MCFDAQEPTEIIGITRQITQLFAPLFIETIGFKSTFIFINPNLNHTFKVAWPFRLVN